MFALGLLACIYDRDLERCESRSPTPSGRRARRSTRRTWRCWSAATPGRRRNLDFRVEVPAQPGGRADGGDERQPGDRAGRGGRRDGAGGDVPDHPGHLGLAPPGRRLRAVRRDACTRRRTRSPPPAWPSARSYAGKVAFTITSGPGLALKTEFLGLAVMTEIPLVLVDVQRGGPSTGLPTKVEQSDLLAALFGAAGRRAARRARARDHRGVLPLDGHRAPAGGDVPHGGDGALGRQPGHRGAALPAAPRWTPAWQAAPPDLSPGARGAAPLRLGPADRALAALHPRAARRDAHRHRAGARRGEQGGLRHRHQPAQLDDAQPQAGGAAEHAAAARGARRRARRPAGGGLGEHQGRHRGGGGAGARRGALRLLAPPAPSSPRSSRG